MSPIGDITYLRFEVNAIPIYRANDKYRAQLRTTYIASPADTTLGVTAIPSNLPTIVVLGLGTADETVFTVTGTSGTSSSNYSLTGVARLKGADKNLPTNTAVNCINVEDFFNQYETVIAGLETTVNDLDALVYQEGDFNLATDVDPPNITVDGSDPSKTIVLPAAAMSPTTTAGCAAAATVEAGTNDVDYKVLDFDQSTEENCFVSFAMPDSWDGGTITASFIWTTAASSGDVIWGIKGRAFANDAAIDQAYGTAQTVTDSFIAAGDVHVSSYTSATTLAGSPAGGQWVQLKIFRDADAGGDTLNGDARLIAVSIKYKIKQYSD